MVALIVTSLPEYLEIAVSSFSTVALGNLLAEEKLKKEMNQKPQAKMVKDYMNTLKPSEGAA